jgi:predicted permease
MRNEARRRELAVRVALGAGRWRLASQVVGESAWLAGIAGLAGIAVATISLDALLSLIPDGLPRIEAVRVDASVVLFAGAVTFVAALLTGIWPAAFAHRVDLASQFRSREAGRRGVRGRSALVAAQVALAVVIVACAGLLGRSLLNLRAADMGIAAERLVFVDLLLPVAKIADRARHEQFLNALVERLDAEPLIEASTPIHVHPFSGTGGWDVPRFAAGGQGAERAATNPSLNLESVHPGYFHTFDIPILRGRAFTYADRKGATPVAIVSADVAERTWPGEDPIGKRLKMGGPDSADEWRTIVGVVQPNRYRELEKRRATLYLPAAQFLMMSRIVVLRTAAPLDMVASVVRARVPEVDPDAQVVRIAPFSEMLRQPLARPRFYAFIIGVFGIAALVLAIVGLYGVIAASVRQRDRELGIRVALGATARNVRALVLQDTLRLSIAGTLIGLAGAVAATRAVRSMLFEVDPLDPWTLLAAAIALIAASALAAYAPMRRAARADPAMMLRSE